METTKGYIGLIFLEGLRELLSILALTLDIAVPLVV